MKWIGLLFGLAFGIWTAAIAQATVNNDVGFSVAAKLPDNQPDKQHSFFDLKMAPGQTERIQTVIYNVTNRDITVETAIHTAYTNSTGNIEYVIPTKMFDKSLKYRLSDYTKLVGASRVTVPANGSKIVTAQIVMPQANFDGVMLGGWYFRRIDQKETGQVKGSMNITNRYSYVIGIKYTEGRVPAPILKLDTVKPGMLNYHRGIFPYLRNVSAVIVPGLRMKTTITSQESGAVIQQVKQSNVQLAPNSVYKYPILTGKNQLQAGNYHLHMVAKNSAHHWTFDKDFIISTAAAKRYNRDSVDHATINPLWLVLGGALGTLVLVLIIVWIGWLLYRRKRAIAAQR